MTGAIAEGSLRVGRVRGVTTTKWQRVWGERYAAQLDLVDVADDAAIGMVRDAGLDMCFVRLPFDREGLHAIPLYEERMVAWVSRDHAIAAVDEVTLADLQDEQVLTEVGPDSTDLLLAGVVLMVPMSIARTASRRDLTYRPVADAPYAPMTLTWRQDDENPLIQEFIGVVRGRTANSSRGTSGQQPAAKRRATTRDPRRAGRSAPSRAGRARRGR